MVVFVAFTEDDFMRIWKGLFYSMWMSDKPLIQVSRKAARFAVLRLY